MVAWRSGRFGPFGFWCMSVTDELRLQRIADCRELYLKYEGGSHELIEREMLNEPWVMGEDYTICDPYLFTLAQWMEADGVDPARCRS